MCLKKILRLNYSKKIIVGSGLTMNCGFIKDGVQELAPDKSIEVLDLLDLVVRSIE